MNDASGDQEALAGVAAVNNDVVQSCMQSNLHGGMIAGLPLQLCARAVREAAYHFLLQDLAEMVDMAPSLAMRWEQVAAFLGFHLNVSHLHLVLGHLCPKWKQPSCNASRGGSKTSCAVQQ